MDNQEYFDQVKKDFDFTEEMRASIMVAQFFIETMGMPADSVLEELNITYLQYEKYKSLPQS